MPTPSKPAPNSAEGDGSPAGASARRLPEAARWAELLQASKDPDLPDSVAESRHRRTLRLEFPDGSAIVTAEKAGWDWAPHATRLGEAAAALSRHRPAGTEGLSRKQMREHARAQAPFLWCRSCFEAARARLWLPKAQQPPESPEKELEASA